jgi:hypothetical protein
MIGRGTLGTAVLSWAIACGGGQAPPATPSAAVAPPVVETAAVSPDATPISDLPLATGGSCDDRARARPICLAAVKSQCLSQQNGCETGCQPRTGPGSSEKEPAIRGDIEADNCRDGCRQSGTACLRTLGARCPSPCEAGPGH